MKGSATELRDAAIALVWRRAEDGGREVLWMRRGAGLSFAGGFYAFPGGQVDQSDTLVPVEGADGRDAALRSCAVRECFEETGILLARGAGRVPASERAGLRARLLAKTISWDGLLSEANLALHAADTTPAGRWITPEFYPRRFDAWMFLTELREPQQPALPENREADEVAFISPARALERWRDGTALLHPPSFNAFVALSAPDPKSISERLLRPPWVHDHIAQRLEFQEGIVLVPQRTPTLPPATHTNAYLIGKTELILVDPGSDDDAELAILGTALQTLADEGRRVVALALTHHHADHTGGIEKLQQRLGLPLWCHRETAAQLTFPVARFLEEGDELPLPGFPVSVLHLPGHARGHLAFWHRQSGAAIVGDLISSVSSIVISPPDGDMSAYVHSLERLSALNVKTLYPAHGPIVADAQGKLREYLAHRRAREGQILESVRAGAATPGEIVPIVYRGTPASLLPLAERSVLAHLEKLAREGRVEVRGGRYLSTDETASAPR